MLVFGTGEEFTTRMALGGLFIVLGLVLVIVAKHFESKHKLPGTLGDENEDKGDDIAMTTIENKGSRSASGDSDNGGDDVDVDADEQTNLVVAREQVV
jgi:hypothetical protein